MPGRIPDNPKIYHIVHVNRLASIGADRVWCELRLFVGLGLAPRIAAAAAFLESNVETRTRLTKVAHLVEGFESSFGLELLSTVHWTASKERARSIEDIVKMTYAWNDRKRRFTRRQIALAADVLSHKGWIASVNEPDFA